MSVLDDYLKGRKQNNGSGAEYLLGKATEGLVGSVTGTLATVAGGLNKLFGNDKEAERYVRMFSGETGEADYRFNPDDSWKMAGDVAQGIGNSLPMMAAGIAGGAAVGGIVGAAGLTGTAASVATGVGRGIVAFTSSFLSAAGSGVQEAYQKTGKLDDKAWKSGITSGIIEGATEALVDPLLGGTASGAFNLGSKIAGTAATAAAKRFSSKIGVQIAKDLAGSFVSEALEEGVSAILSPIANNLIYQDEIARGEMEKESLDWHDIGYQMLVGGLSGVIMGGANTIVSESVSTARGVEAIRSGKVDQIMQSAQEILNAYSGDETMTKTEAYKHLQNVLQNAEKAKGGFAAARYVAEAQEASAAVALSDQVVTSARQILTNPEAVANRINQFALKDTDGHTIRVTAEEIRNSVKNGNLAEALSEDGNILRKLAVLDAAGRMYADTQAYESAVERGEYLGDRADVAHFIQTASAEEVQAVNNALGLDIATASYDDIRAAFVNKSVNAAFGGQQEARQGGQASLTAQEAENTAQERTNGAETSANTTAEAENATEAKKRAVQARAETEKTLSENVSQWERMPSRNRTLVRQTYTQAVNNGYSAEDALTFARLSAKAGINIEFTENGMQTASGDTVDGYYNREENVIVVNPKSKKPFESILIHELTHSLEGTTRYGRVMEQSLKSLSETERNRIIALYQPVTQGKSAAEKVEILSSEYTAHYTEKALKSKKFLEALVKEDRTIADRIRAFFEQRFGDEKLDRNAQKLAKAYEKAFSEMAQRNFGANAVSEDGGKRQFAIRSDLRFGKIAYIDENLIPRKKGQSLTDAVKEYFNTYLRGMEIPVESSGDTVTLQQTKKYLDNASVLKKQAVQILDDIISIGENKKHTQNYPYSKEGELKKHLGLSATRGWDSYDTRFEIGETIYSGRVLIRKSGDGTDYFYDLDKIKAISVSRRMGTESQTKARADAYSANSIPETSQNVNPSSKKTQKNFSTSKSADDLYMRAVENGDDTTAARMVQEAAEKAGYTHQAYHGTGSQFNVFSSKKMGTTGTAIGKGYYFTTSRSTAEQYEKEGGRVLSVFLKTGKVLSGEKKTITRPEFMRLLRALSEYTDEDGFRYALSNYADVDSYGQEAAIREAMASEYNGNDNDVELIDSLYNGLAGVSFEDYAEIVRKSIGYDTIISDRGNNETWYVTMNSDQSKLSDPVTYDDKGNIIPLSKRFNSKERDIRFSISAAPNTRSSVLSSRTSVPQQSVGNRIGKAATRFQIDFINEFAGIEDFLKKSGVKANDIASAVQSARNAYARAQSQIGYGVLDSSEMRKKGGDLTIKQPGLQKIFADVRDKGEEYTRDFFDYLLNMHNMDRMSLEEKSKQTLATLEQIRDIMQSKNANSDESKQKIAELKKQIRFFAVEDTLEGVQRQIDNFEIEENKPVFGNNQKEKKLLDESIKMLQTEKARILQSETETKKRKRDLKNIDKRLEYLLEVRKNYVERKEAVTAEQSKAIAEAYESKHPEFRAKADQVWAYSRQINRNRVNDGLISAEDAEYNEEKYPHYVPTFRESYTTGISPIRGKNNIAVNKTVYAAEGGGGTIAPIDESLAKQTLAATRAGAVNVIANMIYDAALRGNTDEVEIVSRKKVTSSEAYDANYEEETPKNNEITFYRDGEKITMRVSREIFAGFDAINGTIDFQNPAMTFLQRVMDVFKQSVTTYNPLFVIRNKIRDIQDAGFNTKYGLKFGKLLFSGRAEREIKANSKLWQAFVAAGGMSNTAYDVNEGFQRRVGERGFIQARKNPALKLIDMINIANDFVEQTTRFTEFICSIEAGNSVEQAIVDSQEVTTNFGRKGRIAKKFNATISPFLNPSIQGFDKIVRNVKDATKSKKAFLALLFKVAILGIAPQVLNEFLHGFDDDDDDEYDELSDYVKTNNYLFKVGDVFLRIPKGRLTSAIAGAVVQTTNAIEGRNVDIGGYIENTLSQMSPVENATRTIFSPITDVIANRSWSGGTIESRKFENVAPEYRYDERTSAIAIGLGKVLKVSPKKIHYLLDQYTGVFGDIILPATSAAAQKDMFSANLTIDAVSSNRLSGDFYKLYDDTTYKKNDPNASEEDRKKAADQARFLNRVKDAVSDLQQQKTEIQNSDKSRKEKLEETRVVQALINEAYRQAFAEFDSFSEATGKYLDIEKDDERFAFEMRDSVGAEAALKNYNSDVYDKSVFLKASGVPYEDYFDFYFTVKHLQSDKDKNGETISGSLRAKVLKEIRKLKLTTDQKLLILASRGYTAKDGDIGGLTAESAQKRLLAYVRRVTSGMSKEEKKEFAKMFGMKLKNNLIFL